MDPVARAAKIKADLFEAGYSLNEVDRQFNLRPRGCSDALRQPYEPGERAIAEMLKTTPAALFPERYDADGARLSPQPRQNYNRPETMAERRARATA